MRLEKADQQALLELVRKELDDLVRIRRIGMPHLWQGSNVYSDVTLPGVGRVGLDVAFNRPPAAIHVQIHMRGTSPDQAGFRELIALAESHIENHPVFASEPIFHHHADSLLRWSLPWPQGVDAGPSTAVMASFAARHLRILAVRLPCSA